MKNKKQLSNTAQTGINMVASFMTYGVSMLVSSVYCKKHWR